VIFCWFRLADGHEIECRSGISQVGPCTTATFSMHEDLGIVGNHRGHLAGRRSVRRILESRGDDAGCECGRSQHRARVDPNQVAGSDVTNQNDFDSNNPVDRNYLEAGQDSFSTTGTGASSIWRRSRR